MSAVAELEAQLMANPEDWERWLVYADHLTDVGDEHGVLIRLEYQLEQTTTPRDQTRLRREIEALLREKGWQGGGPLARGQGTIAWRHGYAWSAALAQRNLAAALQRLGEAPHTQFLTALQLANLPIQARAAALGVLRRLPVRALGFKPGPVEAGMLGGVLVSCAGLVRLSLARCQLDTAAISVLAASRGGLGLRALTLRGAWLTDADLSTLARSSTLTGLVELDLSDNEFGPDGLSRLVVSPLAGSLRSLRLAQSGCLDSGAAALASAQALRDLTELDVRSCGLTDQAARAIASSEPLSALSSLRISDNALTAEGALALVRSPTLRALQHLELPHSAGSSALREQLACERATLSLRWREPDEVEEEIFEEDSQSTHQASL